MGEFAVEGAELKRLIKIARKAPISFGFNPGKSDEDTFLGLDRVKQPKVLGKAAKEEGDGNKYSFGTAVVDGKVMRLTCLRELPNMAKRLKRYLKSQKVMLNVELLDENGNILESDIEDDLPDDPELEGEDDAVVAEEAEAVSPPETPTEPETPDTSAQDMAELTKRLGAIAGQIKALPPETAAKLAKPFQNVVALARAGSLTEASGGADKIEAALKMLAGTTPAPAPETAAPPPPAPPPPDPQMLKLMQHVQAMRDRASIITDPARKAAFDGALDKVVGLIEAKEAEKAVAILQKLQEMLKAFAAAAATAAAAPDTTAQTASTETPIDETDQDDDVLSGAQAEAAWLAAFARLEPLVNDALTKGLVEDVDKLRTQWQWAVTNAADGSFDKALDAVSSVEVMLLSAPDDGLTAFEREIGPDARAIASARVKWANVRGQMTQEMDRLAAVMKSILAEEEDVLEEVGAEIDGLTGRLSSFNSLLENQLDEIVNCPATEDTKRKGLKDAARVTLGQYKSALEDPFFQDIDQGNGFTTVAIATPARVALAEIAAALT
jgi:hypothetical protein